MGDSDSLAMRMTHEQRKLIESILKTASAGKSDEGVIYRIEGIDPNKLYPTNAIIIYGQRWDVPTGRVFYSSVYLLETAFESLSILQSELGKVISHIAETIEMMIREWHAKEAHNGQMLFVR